MFAYCPCSELFLFSFFFLFSSFLQVMVLPRVCTLLVLASLLPLEQGFYVPGVAPVDFKIGDVIDVKVGFCKILKLNLKNFKKKNTIFSKAENELRKFSHFTKKLIPNSLSGHKTNFIEQHHAVRVLLASLLQTSQRRHPIQIGEPRRSNAR